MEKLFKLPELTRDEYTTVLLALKISMHAGAPGYIYRRMNEAYEKLVAETTYRTKEE
jgi:hypothetical protein